MCASRGQARARDAARGTREREERGRGRAEGRAIAQPRAPPRRASVSRDGRADVDTWHVGGDDPLPARISASPRAKRRGKTGQTPRYRSNNRPFHRSTENLNPPRRSPAPIEIDQRTETRATDAFAAKTIEASPAPARARARRQNAPAPARASRETHSGSRRAHRSAKRGAFRGARARRTEAIRGFKLPRLTRRAVHPAWRKARGDAGKRDRRAPRGGHDGRQRGRR